MAGSAPAAVVPEGLKTSRPAGDTGAAGEPPTGKQVPPPRAAGSGTSGKGFHIPSLDGIRAVAFGIVFLAHAGLGNLVPGGFGVTVFFFLSGYLITTLLRMEYERTGRIDLRAFFIRRALRILPPLYVVLVLGAVCTLLGLLDGHLTARAVLAQAFFLSNYQIIAQGYEGAPPGAGVYWSLAVEEHFYLVYPFVFLALARWKLGGRGAATLLGTCLAVLAWRMVLIHALGAPHERTYMGSDTRVDSILYGCALALAGNPVLDGEWIAERLLKWVVVPTACVVLLATMAIRNGAFQETWRYSIQGLALIPLFVAAVRLPNWGPFRVLNWRWVAGIGMLSYSLYLVHQSVLLGLEYRLAAPAGARAVLGLGVALLLAWLIRVGVEQPCLVWRRRLLAREG